MRTVQDLLDKINVTGMSYEKKLAWLNSAYHEIIKENGITKDVIYPVLKVSTPLKDTLLGEKLCELLVPGAMDWANVYERDVYDKITKMTIENTWKLHKIRISTHLIINNPNTKKTCSKCKIEKSILSFHRNGNSKDGRQYYCKECSNKKAKKEVVSFNYKTNIMLNHVCRMIENFRIRSGLTQFQVVERTGIKRNNLHAYELCKAVPDSLELKSIADCLGVDIIEFFPKKKIKILGCPEEWLKSEIDKFHLDGVNFIRIKSDSQIWYVSMTLGSDYEMTISLKSFTVGINAKGNNQFNFSPSIEIYKLNKIIEILKAYKDKKQNG